MSHKGKVENPLLFDEGIYDLRGRETVVENFRPDLILDLLADFERDEANIMQHI